MQVNTCTCYLSESLGNSKEDAINPMRKIHFYVIKYHQYKITKFLYIHVWFNHVQVNTCTCYLGKTQKIHPIR